MEIDHSGIDMLDMGVTTPSSAPATSTGSTGGTPPTAPTPPTESSDSWWTTKRKVLVTIGINAVVILSALTGALSWILGLIVLLLGLIAAGALAVYLFFGRKGDKSEKSGSGSATPTTGSGEDTTLITSEIVSDARGKSHLRMLPADQVRVFRNVLTGGIDSEGGWTVNGMGAGQVAIGLPLFMMPYADIDLSEKQIELTITVNPGGESYKVDCVVYYRVRRSDSGLVDEKIAQQLLTRLDKKPVDVVKQLFGPAYNVGLTRLGADGAEIITDSGHHTPENFARINSHAKQLLNGDLRDYGLEVTRIKTKAIQSAASETATETAAVVNKVGAGLDPAGKNMVAAVATAGTLLRPLAEAWISSRSSSGSGSKDNK
ncbi:MAG: hypothetical protein ABIG66_01585 [Candidatus Kerfeldbacteria bacterium]